MSGKKKILIFLLLCVMVAAVVSGFMWSINNYWIVDFQFYPKDTNTIDLRGKEVSAKHYDALREELPGVTIYWNIPFQENYYDQDCKHVTVTTLTDADVLALDYFTELETVDARACKDYAQLLALRQRRPEVDVDYSVVLGGEAYDPDTEDIVITAISQEEISLLEYLPNLKTVAVGGGDNTDNFAELQSYCRKKNYLFRICIGETQLGAGAKDVTLVGADEEELKLLAFLPDMETLHLENPEAPVETLLALQRAYANVEVTWSASVAGKMFQWDETLIDISNMEVADLQQIEEEMTYFPKATQLEMHSCGVENEDMAAFREAHREDYKVVWTVMLGPKLPTRTDVTSIMPARDGTSDFHDAEAYNMRYCEDVIAVDVGHLDVRNVEWAAFMPHLQYLIVSWTGVKDLTPLSSCKELVFFEGTDAPIGDLTPLKECTALEDINVSASGAKNSDALVDLPNLKHVWVIKRGDLGWPITESRPDVTVRASGSHTVSGWRTIPNYYKMRDALGMFYMNG